MVEYLIKKYAIVPGIWGIPGTSSATLKDFKSLMCDPTFDSANKEKDLSGNVTGWWVLIPQVNRNDPMSAPDPNPVIGYVKVHIIEVCYPDLLVAEEPAHVIFTGFCSGANKIVIDRISCFPCAGPSHISVNPISLDFGNIPVDIASEAQTLTILNDGNGILAIYPLQMNGTHYSEFSTQNDNCSGKILLPLENCTVDLVFSPTSEGSKNANLSITSNDPDTPTLNVPLNGTGIPLGNAPKEPSNLNATSISASRIKLTWTDDSTDETSFKIYRKKNSGSWKLIATKEANVVSHINWTAAGNTTTTTYSYYVKACNSSGCSPSTKWAVVPYKPTTLTATASSSNQIDLTWTDTSNNETGFQIYKKTGNCSSTNSWVEITQMGPNITSYSDTDLPSGTTYS